ncbi:MAG: PD40 domain-containing protein [Phycisphaerae bacterium]|nr:PD40 domain-containing protein [Phycisphaerae bacterium]
MKWLNGYRMRLILVGFVAGILVGGGTAKADFTFGEPMNLGPVANSQSHEQMPSISADSLEIYFMSKRPGGYCNWDIWVAKRVSLSDPWEEPVNLGPLVNNSVSNWAPCISADGLELYFEANRDGNYGGVDIWVAVRKTKDEPWGDPVNLGPTVNSSVSDADPSVSADGLELYFRSNRSGGYGYTDLWVSKRPTKDEPWGSPVNLGPTVNGPDDDRGPSISADGLTLFFDSDRLNGTRGWDWDIWMTSRKTKDSTWGEPVRLDIGINTIYNDDAPSISADGLTLYYSDYYYAGGRPYGHGGADLWQAPIIPIVDLNGDGIVDAADMCIIVDNWGTDESLCDIGPMPWGDGIVDAQDLIVLAKHLLPAFLAHWELDETEGSIAYDSVGVHNGTLNGNPLWQPAGGKTGGALQLDGIDDYISADFTWDTWKMMISASAWIKGDVPGQVIISQTDGDGTGYGASWLYSDSSSGTLATKLMDPQPALVSESVITDGTWHHIGLVWDGSYRYLYVDGAEVARDVVALSYTIACDGGLYIGAGKYLEATTFFSGLIDDVRIYSKALSAEEIETLAQ